MDTQYKTVDTIVGSQFPVKVIPLLDEAKKSIKIVVYDWRWYPQAPGQPVQKFNQAIVQARRRGVEVRAVTNTQEIVDILKREKCKAKRIVTPRLIHAKMMIIDDNVLIIGSHNYTQNAFTLNYEISVVIRGRQHFERLIEFFNNLFS